MDKLKEKIQLAVNVYKSGNLSKAEQISKKLITSNPKVVFLYNLLGLILTGQKKLDEAIKCYEKGLKIDPNFAMIYNSLGLLLYNQGSNSNIKKAENYYKKSISLNEKIAEPHTNLGNLYKLLNKHKEAIDCYKKAILINPKSAYTYYNLGNTYVALGNFNEAKENFKVSIKLFPNFYLAHRNLSRLIKYSDNDKHFGELKKIYKNINENDLECQIHISFALAKAYDDIKNFDESFKLYEKANSLYRKKINFSLSAETKKFEKIKSTFDKNLYKKYANTGYLDSSPIFIVGMPRSGTTLVEQILSSHRKVFGADEIEFLPQLIKKKFGYVDLNLFFKGALDFDENDFKKIGEEYVLKMKNYSNNFERTTDKLPYNFLSIGFIKLILPNSKIIHCCRDSSDNIFSIFKNHFTSGQVTFAYNLSETIEYYNLYHDLMKHWEDTLPNFILNLKYEDIISNIEVHIRNLLNFCNLDWQNECLKFYNNKRPIKTASDTQVRNKIYTTSIDSWKNYEKYLKEYLVKLKN